MASDGAWTTERTRLGRSVVEVPRLGVGAMTWGSLSGRSRWGPAKLAYGGTLGPEEEQLAFEALARPGRTRSRGTLGVVRPWAGSRCGARRTERHRCVAQLGQVLAGEPPETRGLHWWSAWSYRIRP